MIKLEKQATMKTNTVTVLKEKNNVRLLTERHINGVKWFKVVTLETAMAAACMEYEGSDRAKAEKVFAGFIGPDTKVHVDPKLK
jgi:hypothetical protein